MSKIKENTLSLNLPVLPQAQPPTIQLNNSSPLKPPSRARSNSQNSSSPKMKNAKSEILKIPKARQLLNMDKHIYVQDVQKRIELLGDLREQNYKPQLVQQLHTLCKPKPKKKLRRHKTSFKIPLTKPNIQKLNTIVKEHIDRNRKLLNNEVVVLKEYEKSAPFHLDTLKFFDELDQAKRVCKERFKYERGNLSKNQLVLEHVILQRNVKRELKLRQVEERKRHEKNVIDRI